MKIVFGGIFLLILIAVGVISIGIARGDLGDIYVTGTLNYKISVIVDTPEGEVVGDAVRKVNLIHQPALLGVENTGIPTVKGEAVVVDMGARGVMYGLIVSGQYLDIKNTFPYEHRMNTAEGVRYYRSLPIGTTGKLPKENWPTFVTFTDPDDPKSVTLVRGHKFNIETQNHDPVRKMKEIFGEGIEIKEITITITDEDVTQKVVYIAQNECACS